MAPSLLDFRVDVLTPAKAHAAVGIAFKWYPLPSDLSSDQWDSCPVWFVMMEEGDQESNWCMLSLVLIRWMESSSHPDVGFFKFSKKSRVH